jgi:hypothetical protein
MCATRNPPSRLIPRLKYRAKQHRGPLSAAAIAALFVLVGSMDYSDQVMAQANYCEMVSERLWQNFNPEIKCPVPPSGKE